MEQEELDEIQRLARDAVSIEQLGGYWIKPTQWRKAEDAWRELAAYIMHIATDRANKALIYAKNNPEFLNE